MESALVRPMQSSSFMKSIPALAAPALALSAALAGCSSVPVMGTVRSALACDPAELASEDLPISDALVVVNCPSGQAFGAETDRFGRFTGEAGRPLPLECTVRVSRSGYEPRTYRIADVCAARDETTCFALGISARLSPQRDAEITLAPGLRPPRTLQGDPGDLQTIAGLP